MLGSQNLQSYFTDWLCGLTRRRYTANEARRSGWLRINFNNLGTFNVRRLGHFRDILPGSNQFLWRGFAVLATRDRFLSMLTWLIWSDLQRYTHTQTNQEVFREKKNNFLRSSQAARHVAQTIPIFSTNVGVGDKRLSFIIPAETKPVLPVIMRTKHIFEPRRRTSQSFWPRRGATSPEPCLSKRAHLEVYKEAFSSLFSYYTWK